MLSCHRPVAGVAAASLFFFASAALAQTRDHLQCYKIRDQSTFDSAAVDLEALQVEFGLQSCTIKSRAKKFCVPVSANVTSVIGGTAEPIDAAALVEGRLCYKLRCPATEIEPQDVTDAFGERSIGGFKAVELCTPVTPPTTTTTMPADTLDDSFDGSSLDASWTVLHPSKVTVSVTGGALHLIPTMTGGPNVWFDAGEGPLVYKEVTGDFDVQTTITVRDPANTSNPPPTQYRLAGILARDPAGSPASSNTVHVALGAGAAVQGTCYEYKSTDDSSSTWVATPTASASAQLRLRRSVNTVEMYWRAVSGDSWTMIQSFNRPDLPATLQIGPMIYSVDSPPSIEALFDEIVFN
jgi:hypothetical protein